MAVCLFIDVCISGSICVCMPVCGARILILTFDYTIKIQQGKENDLFHPLQRGCAAKALKVCTSH